MKAVGVWGVVIVGVCAGLGGYLLGSAGEKSSAKDPALQPKSSAHAQSRPSSHSGGSRSHEPNLRGYELSNNPQKGLEILLAELRQSPMAQMDFEALFGIWDMVQYLDAYELQGLIGDLEEMGGGQEVMSVKMMLLNRWAAKDGLSAMEYAVEGEGMLKAMNLMGAMMGWMRSSPEDAYAWVKQNGDQLTGGQRMGMGKEQLEAMYFSSMARTDFEGAMRKLDELDVKMQSAVIAQMMQANGADEEKRNQLLDHLKAGGNPKLLKEARSTIVGQLSWQDPQAALAFIESEQLGEGERKTLEETTFAMWAHTDPEGALTQESEQLKGQEGAGDEIADTFGSWLAQDEGAAAAWLAQQGDEFKTDRVFSQSGRQLAREEKFDRAADWYEQVLNDNQRQRGYGNLYENWKDSAPEDAEKWRLSLPEADQLALEKRDEDELRDRLNSPNEKEIKVIKKSDAETGE